MAETIDTFNFKEIQSQLDEFGWAVVPNVITQPKCAEYIRDIQNWLKLFSTTFPSNIHSIIHQYNISHIEPAWKTRLDAKKTFAGLWQTEKLHTSMDGIAIGRPPEDGETEFDDKAKGANQLHLDQEPRKVGLHAYQGAVYLEEANLDDWTFMVIEKSHKFHADFFNERKASKNEFRKLNKTEIKWYEQEGCTVKRLCIPQGGMVLWDSRTVHAGAPPKKHRHNPGRWRYVVFVSMTPAVWSGPLDYLAKKEAYENLRVTRHWSSQGFSCFKECRKHKFNVTELPEIAKTKVVKQLSGVMAYDFDDGISNGPKWKPVFKAV